MPFLPRCCHSGVSFTLLFDRRGSLTFWILNCMFHNNRLYYYKYFRIGFRRGDFLLRRYGESKYHTVDTASQIEVKIWNRQYNKTRGTWKFTSATLSSRFLSNIANLDIVKVYWTLEKKITFRCVDIYYHVYINRIMNIAQ